MMEFGFAFVFFLVSSSFFSSHPLLLCSGLVLMSLSLSPIIMLLVSKWLAYAIILIFLGGMMIIFIYASTLASNEKLVFTWKPFLPPFLLSGALVFYPLTTNNSLIIAHLYSTPSAPLIFFLTFFLLFTLFTVIYLSQSFKGALMNYL